MRSTSLALAFLVIFSACGGKKAEAPTAGPAAASAASGTVLANLDGVPITEEEVRKVAGAPLAQAERELYDARKDGLDQIIDEKLLEAEAKRKGTTKEDLLKKEVIDKIKIDDREIGKFYNEKKSQMQGKKLDEMKGNIRGVLFREKHQKLYGDLVGGLKKKIRIEYLIKAPRVEIDEGDSPAIGPNGAPIRLVEFTDYQCPFCGRARPAVNQILAEYKGKVRYVLRDFPLSFHKDAQKAHEAAHCAADQGKYWEMNKKLFGDQKTIKVEDLKRYAGELKLKGSPFNDCLDSGKYAEKVRKDQEYGESVGVSGTPAFFVNGRMISGARPFEAFKEIIDDELEQTQ